MAYYLKEILKFEKKVFIIGTTGMIEELDALDIPHIGSGVGYIGLKKFTLQFYFGSTVIDG